MIRVCHMTSAHTPGDNRVFRKECRTLARAGYEVYYVVPGGETGECDGVHIVGTGEKPASRWKRFTAMARRTYEAAKALDCDVYHFHDTELLPYGLKLARAGKTVIYDSHECYPLLFLEKEYIPGPLRPLAGRIFKAYETHVVKHLDAVISPCLVEGADPFAGRAKRSVLLDNLPELASIPAQLPERTDDGRTIGYVGRLSESRGITQLVCACHRVGARLRLAGPVPPKYLAQLQAMPEYECVEYLGVLPYEQVFAFCGSLTAGACILMHVGQYDKMDNLATKIYEYLGAGLPIITNNSRACRRFLEECPVGYCADPNSVEDIAQAIGRLLADPGQAQAMGAAGRRGVLEKYNWENESGKLLELYAELAGVPEQP